MAGRSRTSERRKQLRRRHAQRGGRRADDPGGLAPVILVIDPEPRQRRKATTILEAQHFAVFTMATVDDAVSLLRAMQPAVIACPALLVTQIALRVGASVQSAVFGYSTDLKDLLEGIRIAIRRRPFEPSK